jgi:hypothetical protein
MAYAGQWASQAAQDALLRFNPQRQALAEMIREAGETYRGTVQAGNVAAKGAEISAKAAMPTLQNIYKQGQVGTQAGVNLLSSGLANLPSNPSLNQYRANELGEAAAQLAAINRQGAGAEAMMAERGPIARQGAQFNALNAQNTLARTLSQLMSKRSTIGAEEALFGQSEAEKLAHEAEGVEQRREAAHEGNRTRKEIADENNEIKRQIAAENNATRAALKGAGKKQTAPGVNEATTDQTNKAREDIEKMRLEAYHLRMNHNLNYNQANEVLQTPVKVKGGFSRGAYTNSGKLRAALDLAYFGGVGAGAVAKLHGEGYGLGRLGFTEYHPPAHPANLLEAAQELARKV